MSKKIDDLTQEEIDEKLAEYKEYQDRILYILDNLVSDNESIIADSIDILVQKSVSKIPLIIGKAGWEHGSTIPSILRSVLDLKGFFELQDPNDQQEIAKKAKDNALFFSSLLSNPKTAEFLDHSAAQFVGNFEVASNSFIDSFYGLGKQIKQEQQQGQQQEQQQQVEEVLEFEDLAGSIKPLEQGLAVQEEPEQSGYSFFGMANALYNAGSAVVNAGYNAGSAVVNEAVNYVGSYVGENFDNPGFNRIAVFCNCLEEEGIDAEYLKGKLTPIITDIVKQTISSPNGLMEIAKYLKENYNSPNGINIVDLVKTLSEKKVFSIEKVLRNEQVKELIKEKGVDIFKAFKKFTTTKEGQALREALDRANIDLNKFDGFIPHISNILGDSVDIFDSNTISVLLDVGVTATEASKIRAKIEEIETELESAKDQELISRKTKEKEELSKELESQQKILSQKQELLRDTLISSLTRQDELYKIDSLSEEISDLNRLLSDLPENAEQREELETKLKLSNKELLEKRKAYFQKIILSSAKQNEVYERPYLEEQISETKERIQSLQGQNSQEAIKQKKTEQDLLMDLEKQLKVLEIHDLNSKVLKTQMHLQLLENAKDASPDEISKLVSDLETQKKDLNNALADLEVNHSVRNTSSLLDSISSLGQEVVASPDAFAKVLSTVIERNLRVNNIFKQEDLSKLSKIPVKILGSALSSNSDTINLLNNLNEFISLNKQSKRNALYPDLDDDKQKRFTARLENARKRSFDSLLRNSKNILNDDAIRELLTSELSEYIESDKSSLVNIINELIYRNVQTDFRVNENQLSIVKKLVPNLFELADSSFELFTLENYDTLQERNAIISRIDVSRERIGVLDKRIDALGERVSELDKRINVSRERIGELDNNNSKEAQTEKESLKLTLEEEQAEKDSLKLMLEEKQAEKESLKLMLEEQQTELGALQTSLASNIVQSIYDRNNKGQGSELSDSLIRLGESIAESHEDFTAIVNNFVPDRDNFLDEKIRNLEFQLKILELDSPDQDPNDSRKLNSKLKDIVLKHLKSQSLENPKYLEDKKAKLKAQLEEYRAERRYKEYMDYAKSKLDLYETNPPKNMDPETLKQEKENYNLIFRQNKQKEVIDKLLSSQDLISGVVQSAGSILSRNNEIVAILNSNNQSSKLGRRKEGLQQKLNNPSTLEEANELKLQIAEINKQQKQLNNEVTTNISSILKDEKIKSLLTDKVPSFIETNREDLQELISAYIKSSPANETLEYQYEDRSTEAINTISGFIVDFMHEDFPNTIDLTTKILDNPEYQDKLFNCLDNLQEFINEQSGPSWLNFTNSIKELHKQDSELTEKLDQVLLKNENFLETMDNLVNSYQGINFGYENINAIIRKPVKMSWLVSLYNTAYDENANSFQRIGAKMGLVGMAFIDKDIGTLVLKAAYHYAGVAGQAITNFFSKDKNVSAIEMLSRGDTSRERGATYLESFQNETRDRIRSNVGLKDEMLEQLENEKEEQQVINQELEQPLESIKEESVDLSSPKVPPRTPPVPPQKRGHGSNSMEI